MATQTYNTAAARIGKLAGTILAHAVPVEVLGITGTNHRMPRNKSDTIIFRRWLPRGGSVGTPASINRWSVTAAEHLTQEGVTPPAETLTPQDIPVQLFQYSCLYMYTDKTAVLYEDNIPDEMKIQTGERMGLVREMVRYGVLKGNTNKFYAGGTSRATVDETVNLGLLRKVSRSLLGNRGKLVTRVLEASSKYSTTPVEAGFIVFCHTDMEHDIRELQGFVPCVEYGSRQMLHQMELGATDRYRFVISPELTSIADAGAAVGATGLYSTGGSNIDVYPIIVVAARAWGDVALRGMNSFEVTHIPHGRKEKSDPHGQRGYIGAIFWDAAFIQNDGWMAVIECGATAL